MEAKAVIDDQSNKTPKNKNIIICADGTGNKGGVTPDSNVYKIYKAIHKNYASEPGDNFACAEQVVFYDNGVGTAKNKYLRALGAGLGFGFEDNVCDLYKFLARNYEPGDRIYFFGFSRGASTVRACNGFISICGLAKGKGKRNSELDDLVEEAFLCYTKHQRHPNLAKALKNNTKHNHGAVPVYFMGVWDTVVALGFPKRTDITGPVSAALNAVFFVAENVLDSLWPHSFYHYKLTDNVQHAYQALAIDDERTAFWPYIWREKGRESDKEKSIVEQVWFAGMHSNVGGGYPRSGMASVALYWMLLRAQKAGLKFEPHAIQQARDDSHVHGRMYDSRDGTGMIYRYHPREIEKLCDGRLQGNINIHCSVIERINHRTANYVPGQLPGTFDVIEDDPDAAPEHREPGKHADWSNIRADIDQWVLRRKGLYAVMITFILTTLVAAFRTWREEAEALAHTGLQGEIADVLDYLLPEFFEPLIDLAVIQQPAIFYATVLLIAIYILIRRHCRNQTVKACEQLRHLVIEERRSSD